MNNIIITKLTDCYNEDGSTINMEKWYRMCRNRKRVKEQEEEDEELQKSIVDRGNIEVLPSRTIHRTCFRKSLNLCRADDGTLKHIGARESAWYVTYIEAPDLDDEKFGTKFRRRFRCSYTSFQLLLGMVKQCPIFERWTRNDAVGRLPSPVELLLLGVLRYLGRGWTFDDLEETTCIGEETHRQFFHLFILWGSTELFDLYVTHPTTSGDEFNGHSKEMEVCGLHGCIASTDATHVTMNRCPLSRSNENTGFKEKLPSRSYNICVNHRRQILHTTKGHPSRWNDKTLATFDTFVMKIKRGEILQDNIFFYWKRMKRMVV